MSDNHDDHSGQKWSVAEVLLLFLGLALPYLAFFADAKTLNVVRQLLDVRRWNGLFGASVAATVVFAIYWIRVWRRDAKDPLDKDAFVCAKRFLLVTSLLLIELWGGALLSTTGFPRYVRFQLQQFFSYGVFSSASLGVLLGMTLLLAANGLIISRWLVVFLDRYGQ